MKKNYIINYIFSSLKESQKLIIIGLFLREWFYTTIPILKKQGQQVYFKICSFLKNLKLRIEGQENADFFIYSYHYLNAHQALKKSLLNDNIAFPIKWDSAAIEESKNSFITIMQKDIPLFGILIYNHISSPQNYNR